jgi:hypothetical protein
MLAAPEAANGLGVANPRNHQLPERESVTMAGTPANPRELYSDPVSPQYPVNAVIVILGSLKLSVPMGGEAPLIAAVQASHARSFPSLPVRNLVVARAQFRNATGGMTQQSSA